jgi:hypothetical protein
MPMIELLKSQERSDMDESDQEFNPNEWNERLRLQQQADSEANRLAIEQLKERLGYPAPSRTRQKGHRPLCLIELALVLYVLIALERAILERQPLADASIIGLFVAVDLLVSLLVLCRLQKPA